MHEITQPQASTQIFEDLPTKYLKAGLSVIPLKPGTKQPAINWKPFQSRIAAPGELRYNGTIATVCGAVSGNLEAIDFDSKNDSGHNESLLVRFSNALNEAIPDLNERSELLNKLVIQQTPSGGTHFIYRCSEISAKQVLAKNKNNKPLIEVQGNGDLITLTPSPGYMVVTGSLENIPEITPEQRDTLHTAARTLNEFYKEPQPYKLKNYNGDTRPGDDYNQRVDAQDLLDLLIKHGWELLKFVNVPGMGNTAELKRPDKKRRNNSAHLFMEIKRFKCFSTSTRFDTDTSYSPFYLFTLLECNGDASEAGKCLRAMGYGSINDRLTPVNTAAKEESKGCALFRLTQPTSMERPKKLFGSVWAQGENAFLFGEDGSCKSILSIMIARAIGTGMSIPGFITEVIPQMVAVIDAELSDYQFNSRYPEGQPDKVWRFTFNEDQQAMLFKADIQFVVDQIRQAADSIGAKIIILDNLSALAAMLDLTKTSESIQLMGLLNELKKQGYSILIIDHCRKPMRESEFKAISKHDLQGSKMKTNLVDSVFSIGKSCQGENIRYIKGLKIRSYEMAYTKTGVATMMLNTNPLRLDFIGIDPEWSHLNDRNSKVDKLSGEGKSQAEIAREFGITQQAVSKILKAND